MDHRQTAGLLLIWTVSMEKDFSGCVSTAVIVDDVVRPFSDFVLRVNSTDSTGTWILFIPGSLLLLRKLCVFSSPPLL